MKIWLRLSVVAGELLLAACTTTGAGVSITHTTVPSIKAGGASMDAVEIDQKGHRLYVADRTDGGVDVFDVASTPAKFLQTIATSSGPNGIAVAPDLGLVFVGLSDGTVAVIDENTLTVVNQINTGAKTIDLVEYSAAQQRVYASSGGWGTIASIDASTGEVKATFKIGKALEQPRYDAADHMLYVPSPDAGALYQLDAQTGAIKQTIPIPACSPKGLAINPKLQQALIACSSWILRVNLRDPADVHAFTQVGGGDLVTYDASADRFFVAAPGAIPSEVALFGGNPIDYVVAVEMGGFGNGVAYDETNGVVYTQDIRSGQAGVAAFKPPSGEMLSASPSAVALFAGMVAVILAVFLIVGRQADPVHRPAPAPERRQTVGEVRAGARRWTKPS